MIGILYPLKMTKNLYEAYSAIYEISAGKAIEAAKAAEQNRAKKAKEGDTEGAIKAIGQNKKFFDYARKKRQKENMPKKPTQYSSPVSKPVVDYSKPYPGTGKKETQTEDTKAMKDFLDKKAKKLEAEDKKKKPEYKNNPAFGDPSHHSNAKSKNESYDAQDDAVDQIMGGGKRDAQKDAVKQYVKYSSKKKKMAKEETINELESRTMLNYIDKASDSASKELKKAKKAESKGKFKKATKARLKMDKRESGIEMAKDKIMKRIKKEGKFRSEWEEMKLNEINDYRSKFDEWLDNLVKEGYDIERWSDEELIDTFIDESNLWKSRDTIESALLESDKKGKGSGKKDACYKKVKASASVWPSAYASGRLVQCRKKGAANYGNSTKKEEFSNWRDELNIDEALATTSVIAGAALNRNKKMTGLTVKNTGNKSAV